MAMMKMAMMMMMMMMPIMVTTGNYFRKWLGAEPLSALRPLPVGSSLVT